jgi:hypothetical protein
LYLEFRSLNRQGDKYYRYDKSGRRIITVSCEGTSVYRYNLDGQLAEVHFSYKSLKISTTATFYNIYDEYNRIIMDGIWQSGIIDFE